MTKPTFWPALIAYVKQWVSGSRHDDPAMVPYLREVRLANAAHDTRRKHAAIERARAARTQALRFEVYGQ